MDLKLCHCVYFDVTGLNFYGLYKRKNYDDSESESISQLAVDVPMNEGRELELQPGTDMTIKVYIYIYTCNLSCH